MRNTLYLLIFILFPLATQAQEGNRTYPAYTSTYVNDFADLIPAATEERIAETLKNLRNDTGVEMTVVTVLSRHDWGEHGSLERFATGLFNNWGIGDATRNDGILILVLRDDREMRIELGRGYGREFDWPAQNVIDEYMLPRFKDGDYAVGIEAGTNAAIREIAMTKLDGLPALEKPRNLGILGVVLMAVLWIGAVIALKFKDKFIRLKRCPSCGRRGLHRHRDVEKAATKSEEGRANRITECRNCDYRDDYSYRLVKIGSRSSSSSSSSFGGGGSSGGGASGRW